MATRRGPRTAQGNKTKPTPESKTNPNSQEKARIKEERALAKKLRQDRKAAQARLKMLIGDDPSCLVKGPDGKYRYADHAREVMAIEAELGSSSTLPVLHAKAAELFHSALAGLQDVADSFDSPPSGKKGEPMPPPPGEDDLGFAFHEVRYSLGDLDACIESLRQVLDLLPSDGGEAA